MVNISSFIGIHSQSAPLLPLVATPSSMTTTTTTTISAPSAPDEEFSQLMKWVEPLMGVYEPLFSSTETTRHLLPYSASLPHCHLRYAHRRGRCPDSFGLRFFHPSSLLSRQFSLDLLNNLSALCLGIRCHSLRLCRD
jgi:hypothetical protein